MATAGFTLVELLIVISLLGVIALIVISAINPIEQANRASDAGMKADSSQVISAIERYYASHSKFPWETVTPGTYTSSDISFPSGGGFIQASDINVGLCGNAGCTTQGELMTALELKSEFLSRKFLKATTTDGKIMIGKATGSSSSVYACYIPKSDSNRKTLIANAKVASLSFTAAGIPTYSATCATTNWATSGCYECIPE